MYYHSPFQVNTPVEVPIWVALALRSKGQCAIKQPDWLTVDYLKERYKEEDQAKPEDLTDLKNYQYFETCYLLLRNVNKNGIEDFEKIENVKKLLEDIVRFPSINFISPLS